MSLSSENVRVRIDTQIFFMEFICGNVVQVAVF